MPLSYNCVELTKVLMLVHENKDKLYMLEDDIGSYPIDNEQILKVREAIKESGLGDNESGLGDNENINISLDFFNRIIQIIRYVNFKEYLDKIKNICDEIKNFLYNNHDKYNKIFFGGYGDITKSYTWVLFLFLNEMNDFFMMNNTITSKIFVGQDDITNTDDDGNKYLYLFFDDMSYSGTQISGSIQLTSKSINIDIYITTPFISSVAIEKIRGKNKKVLYWNYMEVVDSLKNSFMKDIKEDEIEKYSKIYEKVCTIDGGIFYKGYQCHEVMIPIYFDHKIADCMSTFQKLLFFGSYPVIKPNLCERIPLFKKCIEKNTDIYNGIPFCTQTLFYINEAKNNVCPKTFYKSIIYNFKEDDEMVPDYEKKTLTSLIKYYDTKNKFIDRKNSQDNSQDNSQKLKQKYIKYKIKYLNLVKLLRDNGDKYYTKAL